MKPTNELKLSYCADFGKLETTNHKNIEISFSELHTLVTNKNGKIAEMNEQIKTLFNEGDESYKEIKNDLSFVMTSHIDFGHNEKNAFEYRPIGVIDIDFKNEKLYIFLREKISAELIKNESVIMFGVSPSGRGIKGFFYMDNETPEHHSFYVKEFYLEILKNFANPNITADERTPLNPQFMFSDENAYLAKTVTPFKISDAMIEFYKSEKTENKTTEGGIKKIVETLNYDEDDKDAIFERSIKSGLIKFLKKENGTYDELINKCQNDFICFVGGLLNSQGLEMMDILPRYEKFAGKTSYDYRKLTNVIETYSKNGQFGSAINSGKLMIPIKTKNKIDLGNNYLSDVFFDHFDVEDKRLHIVSPTGTGKTTLIEKIIETILKSNDNPNMKFIIVSPIQITLESFLEAALIKGIDCGAFYEKSKDYENRIILTTLNSFTDCLGKMMLTGKKLIYNVFLDEIQVFTTAADKDFLNKKVNNVLDMLVFIDRVYTFTATPTFNYDWRLNEGFKTMWFTKNDGKVRKFQVVEYVDRRASIAYLTEREMSVGDKPFIVVFLNDKGAEKTNILSDLNHLKIVELNASTKNGEDMEKIRKSEEFGLETDGMIVTDFFQNGISIGFKEKRRVVVIFADSKHPDQMYQISERGRVNLNNYETIVYCLMKIKINQEKIGADWYDHTKNLFYKNNELKNIKNDNSDFSTEGENNYLYNNSIDGRLETNATLLSYDSFESYTRFLFKCFKRIERVMIGWGFEILGIETLEVKTTKEKKESAKIIVLSNREENKKEFDEMSNHFKVLEKIKPSNYVGTKKEMAGLILKYAKLKKGDGLEIGNLAAWNFISENFFNEEYIFSTEKEQKFRFDSQRFYILSNKKTEHKTKQNLYKSLNELEIGSVYKNETINNIFKKHNTERLKDQSEILDTFFDYEKKLYKVNGETIRGYVFKTKKTFDFINALD